MTVKKDSFTIHTFYFNNIFIWSSWLQQKNFKKHRYCVSLWNTAVVFLYSSENRCRATNASRCGGEVTLAGQLSEKCQEWEKWRRLPPFVASLQPGWGVTDTVQNYCKYNVRYKLDYKQKHGATRQMTNTSTSVSYGKHKQMTSLLVNVTSTSTTRHTANSVSFRQS